MYYSLCPDFKDKKAYLSKDYTGDSEQHSFQIRVNYC